MTQSKSPGTIVVSKDQIVKCLKLNDTIGVDNRVIRLFKPFDGEIKTDVHREFKGSERYSNPKSAPLHVNPAEFVSGKEFSHVPDRSLVDTQAAGVPELVDDRSDKEQEIFNEAYKEVIDVWERDVRGSLVDELVLEPVYPDEEKRVFDVEYVE